jgi:hypothetical protein
VIDLHEIAAEYVAVPVVAPTPTNVIVARGRQLRARRRRRLVATLLLIAVVPGVAIATIRTHRESSVHVYAPSPTTSPPSSTRAVTSVNPCMYPGGRVKPVPGFDPFTASDTEIRAQDFPPRPRPGEPGYDQNLAAWNQYVTWYLTGQVYRCLTPRIPSTTGPGWGRRLQEPSRAATAP